jgi:hypothetical protein
MMKSCLEFTLLNLKFDCADCEICYIIELVYCFKQLTKSYIYITQLSMKLLTKFQKHSNHGNQSLIYFLNFTNYLINIRSGKLNPCPV